MSPRRLIAGTAGLALLAGVVLAQAGFEFMPDGGRTLALQAFGTEPDLLSEIAARSDDAEGWQAFIAANAVERGLDFSDAQTETLSHYLALNMPLADLEDLTERAPEDLARALPRDGKDLAIQYCQGCHGFYTAYLGHDREVNGWLVVFNSPFHMEIRMDPTERRTFAHYSAINLPMRIEDVPPDMRF